MEIDDMENQSKIATLVTIKIFSSEFSIWTCSEMISMDNSRLRHIDNKLGEVMSSVCYIPTKILYSLNVL